MCVLFEVSISEASAEFNFWNVISYSVPQDALVLKCIKCMQLLGCESICTGVAPQSLLWAFLRRYQTLWEPFTYVVCPWKWARLNEVVCSWHFQKSRIIFILPLSSVFSDELYRLEGGLLSRCFLYIISTGCRRRTKCSGGEEVNV